MRLIDADTLEMVPDENNVMNRVRFIGRSCGKTIEMVQTALRKMIDNAPTIEAEPVRHGRWIKNEWVLNRVTCSECKCYFDSLEADLYCPNCGSKMDLEV